MEFMHEPVLLSEAIEALDIKPAGIYIDGTVGGGGHSEAILSRLTTGKLLSIDQDPDALKAAKNRLGKYEQSIIAEGNFADMKRIAAENGITEADGILLDIGVSSHQLDTAERGFSYHTDAPLDMRMSQSGKSAKDLINTLSHGELADIIRRFGEDKNAGRIASGIITARERGPIETTAELAEIIKASVPAAVRRADKHPARKTFQALRIATNSELDALSAGLESALDLLKPGGRLAVITFHSLEDRIVKKQMAEWAQGCTCPPEFPVCICGREPKVKLLYKRGISPSEDELKRNPRARSARLRAVSAIDN